MAIEGFGEIAEQLRRSTVLIHAQGHGGGSGTIWSSDGAIVTNAHVVRGSGIHVQLWDGRPFAATVVSRDARRDLAVLRIGAGDLPAAPAADSSKVRPGELAIAVGNPLGFVGALTTGMIHAVGPIRGLGPQPWIQAAVRLAPGSSGGPLADARGCVIGINTMVAGRLALAIPSNAARDLLLGYSADAWLGVTVQPVRVPAASGRGGGHAFGLLVLEVEPGSPAAFASILTGDILLGSEGSLFTSPDDLSNALLGNRSRLLRLDFLRGDYASIRRVTIQLGSQVPSKNPVAA